MKARLAFLGLIFILSFTSPAFSGRVAELRLSGENARPESVLPLETDIVKATVCLDLEVKAKVEFIWTDPAGKTATRTSKIAFPSKTPVSITDTFNLSDYPEKDKAGLWHVDAVVEGRKLSSSFLLTKNRQILTVSAGVKGQKIEVLERMSSDEPDAWKILEVALTDSDGDVRLTAVKAIRRLFPASGNKMLKRAQEDQFPAVRAEAFRSLYVKESGYPVEAAEKASADSSSEVRAVAAGSLMMRGPKESALMKALVKDPSQDVVSAALTSLRSQDGEAVIETLSDVIATGGKPLRRTALDLLTSKKGADRKQAIEAGLKDPDPEIRKAALKVAFTEKDGGRSLIRTLVDDDDEGVSDVVLDALCAGKDMEGVAPGLHSRRSSTRLRAVSCLAKTPGPESVKGLELAIKDSDTEVRSVSLSGLVKAGESGIKGLVEAVSDKDEDIRKKAVSALAVYKTDKAREGMEKAITDPLDSVRSATVDYFTSLEGPGIATILARVSCDDDRGIRMRAISWLSKTAGEESSMALTAFVKCGDSGIRVMAVDVLAGREDPVAAKAVKSALEDVDPEVRFQAASGLLASGDKSSVSGLWSDPAPEIRKLSLIAMAAAPKPDLLPALKELAKDKDPLIRLMSMDVLKEIKGAEAGGLISELASDGDAQVKERARQILPERSDEGAVGGLYVISVEGSQHDRVRAVKAIGTIPGPKSDAAICDAFKTGGPEVRAEAINLIEMRAPYCLEEVVKEISADPDEKLRAKALKCVRKIPSASRAGLYVWFLKSGFAEIRRAGVIGLADKEGYAGELERMLDDKASDVRRDAFFALVKQKYPLNDRLGGLLTDSEPDIARNALDITLSLPNTPEKTDLLLVAAKGTQTELHVPAINGLVPLGDVRALPLFVKYYGEGYEPDEMLKGIVAVKGPDAFDALAYAYRNGNEDRRLLVIRSLPGRGPAISKIFLEALDDKSQAVRRESISHCDILDQQQRQDVVSKGLKDPVASIRKQAFGCLSGMDEGFSAGYAVKFLDDPELAGKALDLLGGIKAPLVVTELAGAVPALREPDVRVKAVSLLYEKGADSGVFVKLLDDPEYEVRRAVVDALIKRDDPGAAFGLIIGGLDKDARISRLCADGLSRLKAYSMAGGIGILFEKDMATHERLLLVAAVSSQPEILREMVVRIKDDTDLKAVLDAMLGSPSKYQVPAMIEGLRVGDPGTRTSLVNAIASLGAPADILAGIYVKHADLRPAVIEAASRNGRITDILSIGLKDHDPAIRRQAAGHIKEVPASLQGGVFTAALSDDDEGVRLAAVASASSAGQEAVLLKAASDKSVRVKRASVAGLVRLKSPEVAPLLVELVRDRSTEVSGEALNFLDELGDVVQSDVWAGLASDSSASTSVRTSAMNSLVSRKATAYIPILVKSLSDSTPEIKDAAERGIQSFGKDSLTAIYPLLRKKELRGTALVLIKQSGDKSAEKPLLDALELMDDWDYSVAAEILAVVGDGETADVLAGQYRDSSIYRKNIIVKTLGHLKVSGGRLAVSGIIADALDSDSDSMRFHAARAAGSLRFKGLKTKLQERVEKERSDLIKSELSAAINAIERTD